MLPLGKNGNPKLKTNFQQKKNNALGATIFYAELIAFTLSNSSERTPKPYVYGVTYLAYLKYDKKTEESIHVSFGTKPSAVQQEQRGKMFEFSFGNKILVLAQ